MTGSSDNASPNSPSACARSSGSPVSGRLITSPFVALISISGKVAGGMAAKALRQAVSCFKVIFRAAVSASASARSSRGNTSPTLAICDAATAPPVAVRSPRSVTGAVAVATVKLCSSTAMTVPGDASEAVFSATALPTRNTPASVAILGQVSGFQ